MYEGEGQRKYTCTVQMMGRFFPVYGAVLVGNLGSF